MTTSILELHYKVSKDCIKPELNNYTVRRFHESDNVEALMIAYYNKYKDLGYDMGTLEQYLMIQTDLMRNNANADYVLLAGGTPVGLLSFASYDRESVSSVKLYNYMIDPSVPTDVQKAFVNSIIFELKDYTENIFTSCLSSDSKKLALFTDIGFTDMFKEGTYGKNYKGH